MTVSYGYYGGAIGDMLNRLAEMGFFSYVLPFLLIFSIVFGLLKSVKIFKENTAVDAIIALAIGLLALQFDMVPIFFSQVFPRFGVALAVLLVLLVLIGLFVDPEKAGVTYTLMGVGIIATLVVLIGSWANVGYGGYFWYNYGTEIIAGVFVLIVIAIVIGMTRPPGTAPKPMWLRNLLEGK